MEPIEPRCRCGDPHVDEDGFCGNDCRVPALKEQLMQAERHITDLQANGTKLIDDQRDLKRLVKRALVNIGAHPDGDVGCKWLQDAYDMLERMK